MSEQSRFIILGAGPSGLGVGLGLSDLGSQTAIIEKQPQVGGLSGSFLWKGHTIDFGPHRLSAKLDIVRVLADEFLGPDNLVKKSQHGVQFGGKLYQFPPRMQDWVTPASFYRFLTFGGSCLWNNLCWIVKRFDEDTFESLVVRKFGRRAYRLVVFPMAKKIWTDPANIDPAFVQQRFSAVYPWEVLKKKVFPKQELNPSTFNYPRKGFQQFWEAIGQNLVLQNESLVLDSTVKRVEVRNDRIVKVAYENKAGVHVIEGDDLKVVSTIPIDNFVHVLSGFHENELSALVKKIQIRSMILVGMEFDQPRTLPFRTNLFPEERFCFNRLFEQNEYSRDTVLPDKSVIVADITLPRGSAGMSRGDGEIAEQVKNELKKCPYVPLQKINDVFVKRVEYAYVVPDIETRKAFHRIRHLLKGISNLELIGRFSVGEYDNSDYALDNGMTLAQMLSGRISRPDYLLAADVKRQRVIVG